MSKKFKLTDKAIEGLKSRVFTEGNSLRFYSKVDCGAYEEYLCGNSIEEVVEPLKKGDKVRFKANHEWTLGFHCGDQAVVGLGLVTPYNFKTIERYEWTEEDLRKQFEEATK